MPLRCTCALVSDIDLTTMFVHQCSMHHCRRQNGMMAYSGCIHFAAVLVSALEVAVKRVCFSIVSITMQSRV